MTRWANAKPDSTEDSNPFKAPKNTRHVGFSGGSILHRKSNAKATVTSSTSGPDDIDFDSDDDVPVVNRSGKGRFYGPDRNSEDISAVSSSIGSFDDYLLPPNDTEHKTSYFVANPKIAIALPPPPEYSGQANGGNSSFLSKVDTAIPRLTAKEGTSTTAGLRHWGTVSPFRTAGVAGDVGLTNLGNTCFLNSGLQCLLHSGKLMEFFLTCKSLDTASVTLSLLQAFQIVAQQVWSGKYETLHLNDFRSVLGGVHPQFKDGRQHDCQEFLALTLDTLHEQLKKLKSDESESSQSSLQLCCEEKMDTESTQQERGSTNSNPKHLDLDTTNSAKQNGHCEVNGCDLDEVSSTTSPSTSDKASATPIVQRSRRKPERPHMITKKPIAPLHRNCGSPPRKITKNEVKNDEKPRLVRASAAAGSETTSSRRKKPSGTTCLSDGATSKKVKLEQADDTQGNQTEENQTSLRDMKGKVEEYWNNHMAQNNTVISSNFQGVFKSTVVCSKCAYVSVTYEPFMYLSLPIPRVTTKDLKVKLVNLKQLPPSDIADINVTLNLSDNIAKLKDEVMLKYSNISVKDRTNDFVVAEVVNHFIVKILDDINLIRHINSTNRNIYMYELNENFQSDEYLSPVNTAFGYFNENSSLQQRRFSDEDWDSEETPAAHLASTPPTELQELLTGEKSRPKGNTGDALTDNAVDNNHVQKHDTTCCICLENDIYSDLRKHFACGCLVCTDCIKRGSEHFSSNLDQNQSQEITGVDYMKCPQCMVVVNHEQEFVPLTTDSLDNRPRHRHRMQLINVIFRCESDSNNNFASQRIFGIPCVIRVPDSIASSNFREILSSLNPFGDLECKYIFVTSDGTRCDSCVYGNDNCSGCEVNTSSEPVFWGRDRTFALCFSNLNEAFITGANPSDMMKDSSSCVFYSTTNWITPCATEPQIDIYDSLGSFAESEQLDEQNGWFCPRCKKNQCATKSMNVCKFPDYLIVYLKRFVFADHSSIKLNNKLTFPLTDLDLKSCIAEECSDIPCVYDLYACVCHFGSASAGHYTAFGKNPVTQTWNYFNDSMVTPQTPGESDYASAYVLFYQRKDVSCNIPHAEAVRISSMQRIAHVLPYTVGNSSNTNTTNKAMQGCLGPPEAQSMEESDEMQLTISSSDDAKPHINPQDYDGHLKLSDPKGNVLNGFIEEKEDNQENHLPKNSTRCQNNVNGSGDRPSSYGLSRKELKEMLPVQPTNGKRDQSRNDLDHNNSRC